MKVLTSGESSMLKRDRNEGPSCISVRFENGFYTSPASNNICPEVYWRKLLKYRPKASSSYSTDMPYSDSKVSSDITKVTPLQMHLVASLHLGSDYSMLLLLSAYWNKKNSDIAVICRTTDILLSIKACPVWYANFNPYELAINGKHNLSTCLGIYDNSTGTPVMKFTIPINDTNDCGNFIQIIDALGSGEFSGYSSVQTVVISGFVDSPRAAESGIVTYSTNLHYNFSCYYPLQYLLNNTQLLTSFGTAAINSNNGSFISTLWMKLFIVSMTVEENTSDSFKPMQDRFPDQNFTSALQQNGTPYPLKQKVYVQVLLNDTKSRCNVDNKTTVMSNGKNKSATFSFESFRFMQHSGQKTSSLYLHCVTRLCQPDECLKFLNSCHSKRRKREINLDEVEIEPVTISSGPIYVSDKASDVSSLSGEANQEAEQLAGTMTGLIIGVIIAAILGAGLIFASVMLFKKHRLRAFGSK
ncbi:zona pellucida-like domain-containing protein 1 [Rhinophrynus dorsalis]